MQQEGSDPIPTRPVESVQNESSFILPSAERSDCYGSNFEPEEEAPNFNDNMKSTMSRFGKRFGKSIILVMTIVGTTLAYACGGLLISFANQIPSVQFDFNSGTTGDDFFQKYTMRLRTRCGSDIRSGGGFEFKNNWAESDNSCWNGYAQDDQWSQDTPRKWVGWMRPVPFMSDVNLLIRITGAMQATFQVVDNKGKTHTARVNSTVGKTATTPDMGAVTLMRDGSPFQLDIKFLSNTVQNPLNAISVLYYMGGKENREKAVLLPFSDYGHVQALLPVAETEDAHVVNAHDVNVVAPRGHKFIPSTVIFFWWIGAGAVCLSISMAYDLYSYIFYRHSTKLWWTKACFEWNNILLFLPASIGWGIADICEVAALGMLDPVIYAVMGQSRLLGTALASTVMLGRRYTPLQWMILTIMVLMVISFSVMSVSARGSAPLIAYFLITGKLVLSVMCSVYAEKHLSADRPFIVQSFWIALIVVPTVSMIFFITAANNDISVFKNGFFGGFDFGWDPRTAMVVLFCIYYCMIPTACVKVSSALTVNLCSAAGLILIYFLQMLIYHENLDVTKFTLTLAIGCTIGLYALSKEYVAISKELSERVTAVVKELSSGKEHRKSVEKDLESQKLLGPDKVDVAETN